MLQACEGILDHRDAQAMRLILVLNGFVHSYDYRSTRKLNHSAIDIKAKAANAMSGIVINPTYSIAVLVHITPGRHGVVISSESGAIRCNVI